ncbi:unnamed protein product [Acanthoscelides obtectus]|nr:unnamed protein product [Acanthoscelides obtectus]CAK1652844.1 SEC14-like protein 4 [Acanthoscelides obtectus]
MIRMTIKVLEHNLALAAKTGENQVVVIFDMEGFNLRQYAWRPAAEVVISLIQMYEANYPEILKACYIINAPRVFAIAFNVIKKFLNEYTLGKIQIFKSDPKKWKPALLSNITPENLPKHYGGSLTDPDGNPRYATVVKMGGKVPKSYYTKNMETPENGPKKEYIKAVVKKGHKLTLDYIVAEEGCFLRWDFRTEGHDIRFGVTMRDENGLNSPVVRHRRVAAHQIDESGVVACQAPATYTITFDNTYSMMRSKTIHYCIFVTPPLEKLNILPTDEETQKMSTPDNTPEDIQSEKSSSAGEVEVH